MIRRRISSNNFAIPPGVALIPEDFAERLTVLKEATGLSWEGMAVCLGVDSRQLLRWRKGGAPNGGAMLSLVRLASRIPGGLDMLLAEGPIARDGRS
ncbi:MAG: hypothetical protein F4Y63_07900 [Chloroflexi bacterium]|nr:hypothetical protein [Chloroflexota bacterium]MYK62119.1 hypothetical protein [Chloroflexota bacterium]